jgi:hypothetical protein
MAMLAVLALFSAWRTLQTSDQPAESVDAPPHMPQAHW